MPWANHRRGEETSTTPPDYEILQQRFEGVTGRVRQLIRNVNNVGGWPSAVGHWRYMGTSFGVGLTSGNLAMH